jgi:hypothetical protein
MHRCLTTEASCIASPLSCRSWPLLVGRTQESMVSRLLEQEITIQPSMHERPETVALNTQSLHLLPNIVAIQLKYDIPRSTIISHLFETATPAQMPDILWPFVRAATSIPYEPYFPDAVPGPDGRCPWCFAQLSR